MRALRLAGILPLGFEIAASISDPYAPSRLGDVVKNFYTITSPYYHLVDPNWVLKVPVSKCGKEAYTPTMLSTGPNRLKECVDLQQCVGFDRQGNCFAYGYCTRTKNVWRFNVDTCEPQYRSCKVFTDNTGTSKSYLYRTVDTGECTADNTGCSAYSLAKDEAGKWNMSGVGIFWQRDDTDAKSWVFTPKVINLNKNVSANCPSNSAGCSAFQWSENTATAFYLKKAPDYLKCYDTVPGTAKIDFPQTPSDLSKISDYLSDADFPTRAWKKQECALYAQPCIPEEVNCNWYTQKGGLGIRVPGKFKPAEVANNEVVAWNDQCDAQCVGYDTYKEMNSNYANGKDRVYILPSAGTLCAAADAGCTGFTNLETAKGGVANTEYFSYLRSCIKPDVQRQKTYYTYEGADASGFQLKTYLLQMDDVGTSEPGVARPGGPKYFYRTANDLLDMQDNCNDGTYKSGMASPDCRQFNDESGNIYYRILANTIAVSDQCTSYRLNETDMELLSFIDAASCTAAGGTMFGAQCKKCFNNGELRDGYCVYQGLPASAKHNAGISHACAQVADSCRAYKGSTGNSYITALNYDFEAPEQVNDWTATGVRISGESTQSGGHSLVFASATAGTALVSKTFTADTSKVYILSFWGKGQSYQIDQPFITVNAKLGGAAAPSVNLGTEWRYYQIKLIPSGVNSSLTITVENTDNSFVYVDNLQLVAANDTYYLIKNSLSVPTICDSNPNDDLPGEALGCQEYRNGANDPFYLTNFEHLCREAAVGCTALVDNYNSEDPGPQLHNYWLSGEGGRPTSTVIDGVTAQCQVPNGKTGCFVNIIGAYYRSTMAGINTSSAYVAADNTTSSPIYLVANQAATCNRADLGCVKAGLQVPTPAGMTFQDVIIKNNPADYSNTLCTAEAVGCRTYRSGNASYFFKDPEAIGQRVCEYRNDIVESGSGINLRGWFWKGTGICKNNSAQFCTADTDCGDPDTDASAVCEGVGKQACYPDYRRYDYYGLFSYGSTSTYNNFVGECPQNQGGCTKFVDHNDTSTATGIDRPYYLIDNDKLRERERLCEGQASLKTGCILIDKSDNPSKYWNTAATYHKSEMADSQAVAPVANQEFDLVNPNDANMIIKAVRDRECGEWLTCSISNDAQIEETGKTVSNCTAFTTCNKAQPEINPSQCIRNPREEDELPKRGEILDRDAYAWRNVNWSGSDFTGYSIYNAVQLRDYTAINNSSTGLFYLAAVYDQGLDDSDPANPKCTGNSVYVGGQCYRAPVPGKDSDPVGGWSSFKETLDCRSYPEESSPLPPSTCSVNAWTTPRIGSVSAGFDICTTLKGPYADANICAREDDSTASAYKGCDYYKVDYDTAGTVYYCNKNNGNKISPQPQFCLLPAGASIGNYTDEASCKLANGIWANAKDVQIRRGWRGYCAERDIRFRIDGREIDSEDNDKYKCLMWYPLDVVNGATDNLNISDSGGLANEVVTGERWMCMYNEPKMGNATVQPYDSGDIMAMDPTPPCEGMMVNGSVPESGNGVGDFLYPEFPEVTPPQYETCKSDQTPNGVRREPMIRYDIANGQRQFVIRRGGTRVEIEGQTPPSNSGAAEIKIRAKPENAIVWHGKEDTGDGGKHAGLAIYGEYVPTECNSVNGENNTIVEVVKGQYLADGRFVMQGANSDHWTVGNGCQRHRELEYQTNFHKFNTRPDSIYKTQFDAQGVPVDLDLKKSDIARIDVYHMSYGAKSVVPGGSGQPDQIDGTLVESQVIVFDADLMRNREQNPAFLLANTHFLTIINDTNDRGTDWAWVAKSNSVPSTVNDADWVKSLFENFSKTSLDNNDYKNFKPNLLSEEMSQIQGVNSDIIKGHGIAYRVHFDNDDNFIGIGAAGVINYLEEYAMNYFFVIYLRPGYCSRWAKVSNNDDVAPDFPIKPVAARLSGATDSTYLLSRRDDNGLDWTSSDNFYHMITTERKTTYSYLPFGLMQDVAGVEISVANITPGLQPVWSEGKVDVNLIADPTLCAVDREGCVPQNPKVACARVLMPAPATCAPGPGFDTSCTEDGKAHCWLFETGTFKHFNSMDGMADADTLGGLDRLFAYASWNTNVVPDETVEVPYESLAHAGLPALYNIKHGNDPAKMAAAARTDVLNNMFAQIYDYRTSPDGLAVETPTFAVTAADNRSRSDGASHAPVIWPAYCESTPGVPCALGYEDASQLTDTNPTRKSCAITTGLNGKINNFTVNNKIGNIIVPGGYAPVTVRFFAFAHPEQMPIRRILVDKNDVTPERTGLNITLQSAYSNFMPACGGQGCTRIFQNNDEVKNKDYNYYGMTPETGCVAHPYNWNFTYNCSPPSTTPTSDEMVTSISNIGRDGNGNIRKYIRISQLYNFGTNTQQKDASNNIYNKLINPGAFGLDTEGIVCIYQPKVQIMDNWGWIWTDGGPEYCDDNGKLDTRCNPDGADRNNYWIKYKGYIIVIPRDAKQQYTGGAGSADDDLYYMSEEEMD